MHTGWESRSARCTKVGAFQAMTNLPVTELCHSQIELLQVSHFVADGEHYRLTGTPLLRNWPTSISIRPLFNGTLIANVNNWIVERGNRLVAEGLADLIAFGRPYIANPDLVLRFTENIPLAEVALGNCLCPALARLFRLTATYQPCRNQILGADMPKTTPEPNKAIVLESFRSTLF